MLPETIKLLVLDDDSTFLNLLNRLMSKSFEDLQNIEGYWLFDEKFRINRCSLEIESFCPNNNVLDYLISNHENFNAIIIDYQLPQLKGPDIVRELRNNGIHIPLEVISSYEENEKIYEAIFSGANNYFSKDKDVLNGSLKITLSKILLDINDYNNQQQIERLSVTDDLTGLYNRRKLEQVLDEELRLISRTGGSLGLAYLDLDDFKKVNDTYGHLAGDKVLIDFSKRMLSFSKRETDFVFRLGGDEFAIVFTNPRTDFMFKQLTEMSRVIKEPYILNDNTVIDFVNSSIGVILSKRSIPYEDIMLEADKMLYQHKKILETAKYNNKNRIENYMFKFINEKVTKNLQPIR